MLEELDVPFPAHLKASAVHATAVHIANEYSSENLNPEEHVETSDRATCVPVTNWNGLSSLRVRIQHADVATATFQVSVTDDDQKICAEAYVTPGNDASYTLSALHDASVGEMLSAERAGRVIRGAVRLLLSSCDAQQDRAVPKLSVVPDLPDVDRATLTPEQQYQQLLDQAEGLEDDAEARRCEADGLESEADDLDREASALRKRAEDVDAQHQVTSPESDLEVGMMVWMDRVRRTVNSIAEPIIWPQNDPRRRDGAIPPKPRWKCLEEDLWHDREAIDEVIPNVRNVAVAE